MQTLVIGVRYKWHVGIGIEWQHTTDATSAAAATTTGSSVGGIVACVAIVVKSIGMDTVDNMRLTIDQTIGARATWDE
jgi:hypothetical protein